MTTRVLVIDDDAGYRRVCELALKKAGFDVRAADDGHAGLKLLENEAIDLVLTDVLMPNTDGGEIIYALRKLRPSTRVIAMSGGGTFEAEECLRMARTLGAAGTLRKPFTVEELVAAVNSALEPAARSDS